ncbi:SPOPL [Cordylochernes scorpioides]|uniref:SPOPL n=1 Tax=Cordylochernes scorpioides TaxID=51811 RepID=A0ABY6KXB0_9ARAC|nr:SPOPL [Cordylochernes scorpioides]
MSIKDQLSDSASKPIADTYCHTVDKMYHSSFMWTIENFTTHRGKYNNELISSFCFESIGNAKFNIHVIPKNRLSDYFFIMAEVSILNLGNEETNKKCVEFFEEAKFNQFISNKYLNENALALLPEDKLTLYFKMNPIKVTECKISNDFLFLLESKELSDVVLKADNNQEIHAHKAILSARSSVFAAMFRNDMKENKENTVDLSHIKYDLLIEVVKYIYTGISTNLPQMAEQILPLAAMYELERLKHLCEKELSDRVTIDTATKLLILADNHSAQQLKEYIINYIKAETAEILNSNDWNMMLSHPILLTEVFTALTKHQLTSNTSK